MRSFSLGTVFVAVFLICVCSWAFTSKDGWYVGALLCVLVAIGLLIVAWYNKSLQRARMACVVLLCAVLLAGALGPSPIIDGSARATILITVFEDNGKVTVKGANAMITDEEGASLNGRAKSDDILAEGITNEYGKLELPIELRFQIATRPFNDWVEVGIPKSLWIRVSAHGYRPVCIRMHDALRTYWKGDELFGEATVNVTASTSSGRSKLKE